MGQTACEQYPGVELIQSHSATKKHTWAATGVCQLIYRYLCPSGYWGSTLCTQCPEKTYTSNTSPATSLSVCIYSHCWYYKGGSCIIPSQFALQNLTISPSCNNIKRDTLYHWDTSWTVVQTLSPWRDAQRHAALSPPPAKNVAQMGCTWSILRPRCAGSVWTAHGGAMACHACHVCPCKSLLQTTRSACVALVQSSNH